MRQMSSYTVNRAHTKYDLVFKQYECCRDRSVSTNLVARLCQFICKGSPAMEALILDPCCLAFGINDDTEFLKVGNKGCSAVASGDTVTLGS